MAAAAFAGQVTIRNRRTGAVQVESFTCSDVANALASFDNTSNNFVQVAGNPGDIADIVDIALSAAGTDTTKLNLRASGKDTGIIIRNAGMVNTVNNRITAPIPIRAGSSIQLKQLT